MSIFPLPVFEADADPANRDGLTDREIYERLKPPTSIVVRYGSMRQVAEYRYGGDAKPGCGSKLVARTHRGTELVEMLTTTCSNSGCGKSVSRQEMLEYIENSGGRDYPFRTDGRVLRVATVEDLNAWGARQAEARERVKFVKAQVAELELPMKVVELEPILGGEILTVYYLSEARIDFRELVRRLAVEWSTRIEMRQVGARDEARLVADYERCGQHCCCKNFLKVLKPISMRSAKTQKGTVDPLKISGRCGRLMCCLRYEDETYEDLKRRLPKNRSRVGTPDGPGIVVDSKILVQLVLVRLESDGREVAVPVEELCDPDACPTPTETDERDPYRGLDPAKVRTRGGSATQQDRHRERLVQSEAPPAAGESGAQTAPEQAGGSRKRKRKRGKGGDAAAGESPPPSAIGERPIARESTEPVEGEDRASEPTAPEAPGSGRKRKRKRRRGGGDGDSGGDQAIGVTPDAAPSDRTPPGGETSPAGDGAPRKRRRRRRRGGGDGGGGDGATGRGGDSGGPEAG